MNFADAYFEKHKLFEQFIDNEPETNLKLIVTIPSINEPDLIASLISLKNCELPQNTAIEVITLINSPENVDSSILEQNEKTLTESLLWCELNSRKNLKFFAIHTPDLPKKIAGAGLARKIVMDEALRRFNIINQPLGIIAGFDADSLCEPNYFIEICKLFAQKPKTTACSIYFEHPTEGTEYQDIVYKRITEYELYLRYYTNALRYATFPFAFQTVGSSFAVNAEIYAKQGGMNRRQAGEDFYFLQKIIPLGNFADLTTTCVHPSPRPSNRVPFGTGAEIARLIEHSDNYLIYSLEAFLLLKSFFENKNLFFRSSQNEFDKLLNAQAEPIAQFLKLSDFKIQLSDIQKYSPNINTFQKRFFAWFNAFRVLKFLNFSHENFFNKQKIENEAFKLLELLKIQPKNQTTSELLETFRKIDKKSTY